MVISSTESVADRHIFGNELDAGRLGFEQQQLREVLFGHAVSDQCLHDVARDRREGHRHVEASCGIKAEIEVIAAKELDKAYDRLTAGDVRYRFVLDTSTIAEA